MNTLTNLLKKIKKDNYKIFNSPIIKEKQKLYSPNLQAIHKQEIEQILRTLLNHYVVDTLGWSNRDLLKTIFTIQHPIFIDRKLPLEIYINKHIITQLIKDPKFAELVSAVDLSQFKNTTITKFFRLEKTLDKHPIFHSSTISPPVDPVITDVKPPVTRNKDNKTNQLIAKLAGLSTDEKTKFIAKHKGQIMDSKASKVVFSKALDKIKLSKINYAKGLLDLTKGDEQLTETLFKTPGITSVKSIAKSKKINWGSIVEERYGKKLSRDKKAKKVNELEKEIADKFPTDYVSSRVTKTSPILKKFLAGNTDVNIFNSKFNKLENKKYNWNGIAVKDQVLVKKEVQKYQRAQNLTHDVRDVAPLINSGYSSASEILSTNRQEFYKKSGLPVAKAKQVYQHALDVNNESLTYLNMQLERYRDIKMPISNTSAITNKEKDLLGDMDYESLFGSLHFCECGHCNSVLSPAAYFVDLLYFLKTNNAAAYTELTSRRADLLDIKLNCDQTNTTQPYLELVNEVLGKYLENNVPKIPNLKRKIDEILYLPWVNPELPFEEDCSRARLLAEQLDMSLFDIYQQMEVSPAVQMAEYLGLGPETLKWMLAPDPLPAVSIPKYQTTVFLNLFNLDYDELSLIVNSAIGDGLSIEVTKIDTQSFTEKIVVFGADGKARANYLKKLFKFLRLYRHLDYSLSDLELYVDLATAGKGILNASNLSKLSTLIYIKDTLNLNNQDLTLLINGYTTEEVSFSNTVLDINNKQLFSEVLSFIGVSEIDFEHIQALFFPSGSIELDAKTLSIFKQNILWSKGVGLAIKDWLLFLKIGNHKKLVKNNNWIELVVRVKSYLEVNVPVTLVDFYVNNIQNENWYYSINEQGIGDALLALKNNQTTITTLEELAIVIAELLGVEDQLILLLLLEYQDRSNLLLDTISKLLKSDSELNISSADFVSIFNELQGLDKNIQVLNFLLIDATLLEFFFSNAARLGVQTANPNSVIVGLYHFSKWMNGLSNNLNVFEAFFEGDVISNNISEELIRQLEDVLELDINKVIGVLNEFKWHTLNLKSWSQFFNAINLLIDLNWSPSQLAYLLKTDTITKQPRIYYRQITAFFEQSIQLSGKTDEQITKLYQEVNNKIIEVKRDAIVALLKKTKGQSLATTAGIYNHFLLDSEMSACAIVSPIKAAILSVQLFIHRCLLNIENDDSNSKLQFDEEAKKEWEWRKNYRVWEANRKVFLYPENYLDPDLRDDKTPIYEALEGNIQQRDLTLPAIEKTYRKYLKEFSRVAKLEMAGSFKDPSTGSYYYLGRSGSKPYTYYYKTYTKSIKSWSHWFLIDVNIESSYVAGRFVYGRMYIFWLTSKSIKKTILEAGTSEESTYHQNILNYCYLEEDNSWSAAIQLTLSEVKSVGFLTEQTRLQEKLFWDFLFIQESNDKFMVYYFDGNWDFGFNHSGFISDMKVRVAEVNISNNSLINDSSLVNGYSSIHLLSKTQQGLALTRPLINNNEIINITDHAFLNSSPTFSAISDVDTIISSSKKLSVINGQDNFNYTINNEGKNYQFLFFNDGLYPLNSFIVNELSELIFINGLDTFLSASTQLSKTETHDIVIHQDVIGHPNNIFLPESGLDFKGPNGIYFQELYFHIPFTLAKHYNNNQKFKEADYWFKKIFDPTLEYDHDQKYWNYVPFRVDIQEQMKTILQDKAALDKYHEDPFNPHAIARLRTGAYPKSIVMSYIDNLLDWGDHLFGQDSYESINEAMMLYITANQLLGERPRSVSVCETVNENKTFREIEPFLDSKNEILIEIESFLTQSKIQTISAKNIIEKEVSDNYTFNRLESKQELKNDKKTSSTYSDSTLTQSFTQELFCIPWNENLMAYWDLVEDRMYKIRHCLNIEGEYRQLALFEPPIDPNLLVRARAAGLNLSQLATKNQLIPYRFNYLLEKARSYVNVVHSFGQAMLSAIEKESGEALNELRTIHESNILQMVTLSKEKQLDELAIQQENLELSAEKTNLNVQYYTDLLTNYSSNGFKIADKQYEVSSTIQEGTKLLGLIVSMLALTPQVGAPTAMTFGGVQLKGAAVGTMNAALNLAEYIKTKAQIAERFQNQNIRNLGWQNALSNNEKELELNEKSKLINEIKQEIAARDLEMHEQRITQNQEVLDFYKDKMSNQALYNHLNGHLTRLYRDAYGIALQTAMDAQAAYQFETGNTSEFYIAPDNWDSASMGLLATEKLQHQLMLLERAHIEQNTRKAEIRSHVSMALIDASALITFKNTGECNFTIPEEWFDIQYPGQYKRRIKSVSVSIPCVTGPYVNVSCKLTLQSSRIRMATDLDSGLENASTVPEKNDRIFTSSAQNDSGLLEFNFRDERYLPFEGAGVDSIWNLQLPNKLRSFNYNTISDVIFHINYTAEYDGTLRESVEENIESNINKLNENGGLVKVMSLKHEFPNEWHKAMTENQAMEIELTDNHFSYFTQRGNLLLQNATIEIINIDETNDDQSASSSIGSVSGALPKTVSISIDEDEKDKELFLVLNYKI